MSSARKSKDTITIDGCSLCKNYLYQLKFHMLQRAIARSGTDIKPKKQPFNIHDGVVYFYYDDADKSTLVVTERIDKLWAASSDSFLAW